MRKVTFGSLIFIIAWCLSWFTHNLLNQDAPSIKQPVIDSSSKSIKPQNSIPALSPSVTADQENIDQLLLNHEFEVAVERYELFQDQLDERASSDIRSKILSHARQLIAQSSFNQARLLLEEFLLVALRDVEGRILLADVYFNQKNYNVAIDQMYEARAYAYRPAMLQQIESHILTMVAERTSSLKSKNDQNALVDFYQQLTQLEPSYAPWFIVLANAQIAIEDKQAAIQSLQLIAYDPDVGAQAQNLLAELTTAITDQPDTPQVSATNATAIPLQRRGNHFIVNARLSPDQNIHLLIDTGASLTMIKAEVFERFSVDYIKSDQSRLFTTANGSVRAPVHIVESLTIGDWQVQELEVGVLAMGNEPHIDGLLGMNFLKHFQFFIDQNQAQLRLSIN